jgi:uncharacterized membrane protein
VTSYVLQAATALHVLAAAVFVGSNVFLDFILSRRLELIPPGQAARLSEKVGADFALLNWTALLVLLASGAALILKLNLDPQLLTASFYATGYGLALATMVALWVTVLGCSAVLSFYLRPRVVVKLPVETRILDVEPARLRSIAMATWLRRLARYNGVASILAIAVGGSLRWGGFF